MIFHKEFTLINVCISRLCPSSSAQRLFRTFVMASLLMSITTGSYAAWTVLRDNGAGESYMVEDQAIKKIGSTISFWYLTNFVPKPGDESLGKSGVVNYEGDCRAMTMRVVYMRGHADQNGKGNVTFVSSMGFDVQMNEAEQIVLKYACSLY